MEKIEEESEEQGTRLSWNPFELFILDMEKPNQNVKIGKHLSIALRMQLARILVEYKDIFAWSSSDLGTISRHITEHKLEIPKGTKLFIQKKRAFTKARQEVIRKEIKALLAAGNQGITCSRYYQTN